LVSDYKEELGQKAFDNNVLRRIFGQKVDKVVEGWTKLHNLYSSQNVIKMIKSRRTKWAEHVACMRGKRNMYMILEGNRAGQRPL
jgi:(p)ppGpp synthase/HD superfamily hydrolase